MKTFIFILLSVQIFAQVDIYTVQSYGNSFDVIENGGIVTHYECTDYSVTVTQNDPNYRTVDDYIDDSWEDQSKLNTNTYVIQGNVRDIEHCNSVHSNYPNNTSFNDPWRYRGTSSGSSGRVSLKRNY